MVIHHFYHEHIQKAVVRIVVLVIFGHIVLQSVVLMEDGNSTKAKFVMLHLGGVRPPL
jgi:hypothetical protein